MNFLLGRSTLKEAIMVSLLLRILLEFIFFIFFNLCMIEIQL